MSQVGVDVVGEVERGGVPRQVHDLAPRAQRIDAVLEDLRLQAVEQVGLDAAACRRLEQLPQPVDLLLEGRLGLAPFLVLPVGRHAEFCVLVHLAVRIWISSGRRPGPITAVCSER